MGMTVDKCLEKLAHERQCFIDECYQNDGELEAYDMAIDTMRKYQKIEQILNNGFGKKDVYSVFDEIVKVVRWE